MSGARAFFVVVFAIATLVACHKDDSQTSDASRGAVYVAQRGCANCHQSPDPSSPMLSGNETAQLGRVFPANLTPDIHFGLGLWSDDQIARAIRDGFDLGGKPLCLQMPRFSRMSDHEVIAIVAYLRSLPPASHPIPQSVCPPIRPDPNADAGPETSPDSATDTALDTALDTAPEPDTTPEVEPDADAADAADADASDADAADADGGLDATTD